MVAPLSLKVAEQRRCDWATIEPCETELSSNSGYDSHPDTLSSHDRSCLTSTASSASGASSPASKSSRARSFGSCGSSFTSVESQDDKTVLLPTADSQITSVRAQYAASSQPGFWAGGIPRENQDAWFVREFPDDRDAIMFGVLDGHGPHGQRIAHAICKTLPDELIWSDEWQAGHFSTALQTQVLSFTAALNDITNSTARPAHPPSGCTGVLAVLQSNRVLSIANLGSCNCMVGGVGKEGSAPYCRPLGTGGGKAAESQTTDGLLGKPDVAEYQVKLQDRYLVLCSEGVSRFLTNHDIIGAVHMLAVKGVKASDISNFLVTEARRLWAEAKGDVIDDCTAIVVLLDTPALSRKLAVHLPLTCGTSVTTVSRSGGEEGEHHSILRKLPTVPTMLGQRCQDDWARRNRSCRQYMRQSCSFSQRQWCA